MNSVRYKLKKILSFARYSKLENSFMSKFCQKYVFHTVLLHIKTVKRL